MVAGEITGVGISCGRQLEVAPAASVSPQLSLKSHPLKFKCEE